MSYSFDARALHQLVEDAEHLIASARDHEQRLADFVRRLESDRENPPSVAGNTRRPSMPRRLEGASSYARFSVRPDLVATARDLCAAAEQQRVVAITILRRVVGELAPGLQNQSLAARVLVVDDAPDNCEIAAMALEYAGFHVITATNGLEAILAAYLANPAVVLMDINMPVLNGIEAARLLKASTATRDLQVIAYTAKPDLCDGPLRQLFTAVLSKPCTPEAIISSVRRCVTHG